MFTKVLFSMKIKNMVNPKYLIIQPYSLTVIKIIIMITRPITANKILEKEHKIFTIKIGLTTNNLKNWLMKNKGTCRYHIVLLDICYKIIINNNKMNNSKKPWNNICSQLARIMLIITSRARVHKNPCRMSYKLFVVITLWYRMH